MPLAVLPRHAYLKQATVAFATEPPSFLSARWFAVNVLGSHQSGLSAHFSGMVADRFAGLPFAVGLGGCPVLEDGIAHFECSVYDRVDAGDHVIFLGRVERMRHRDGVPLLYSSGRYCVPAALEPAG